MKSKRDKKSKKDNEYFNEPVNTYESETLSNAKNPSNKEHDEEYNEELNPDDFE